MKVSKGLAAPFVLVALGLSMTGCGNSTSTAAPEPAAPSTTSAAAPSNTSSAAPASPSPQQTAISTGIIALKTISAFNAIGQGRGVVVEEIDPVSGQVNVVQTFNPPGDSMYADMDVVRMNNVAQISGKGTAPVIWRSIFSADYALVAAAKTMPDGSTHIGWMDGKGTFTDVSANLPKGSDFSSTKTADSPMFGRDGSFYFALRTKGEPTVVMKTTISAPTTVTEAAKLSGQNYFVNPNGHVVEADGTAFEENGTPGTGAYRVQDWISAGEYVATDPGGGSMIYRAKAKAQSAASISDWGTDGTPLIPTTNRTVTSPVVSPDAAKVAFLSPVSSSDAADLFTVPAAGGQPVKVAVSPAVLTGSSVLLGWK